MYKLCFYVPEEDAETVKNAMFLAGAGKVGNYDQCCWQSKGVGQFRPLKGANPHIGQHEKLEIVDELKIEMIVLEKFIQAVVHAMRQNHPYEMPAYDVIKLEEID